MTYILSDRAVQYDALLEQMRVPSKYHSYFKMWVRAYLAFCCKQGVPELHPESLDRFMLSMAEQGKASFQQKQAAQAVSLYGELFSRCGRPEPLSSWNEASGASRQVDGHALTEAGATSARSRLS